MKKKVVKVTWYNGTKSYFDSIETCAKRLGINRTSVYNYLKGRCPMGCKFEYVSMTGEEQLIREVLQIDPVDRNDM